MVDYRPLVLSGTAAESIITELPTSSILITEGVRVGASSLSISGHLELLGGISGTPSISATTINALAISATTITSPDFIFSSTDSIIAASVSATTVSSTAFTGGSFTGTTVSSTTLTSPTIEFGSLSGGAIIGATVSSTTLTSPTITGASVSATSISAVGVSCVGAGGSHIFMKRDDGATYPNLIRATDGTITVQTEDDIHFKSNNGEDFARFNENAAVWLYYNNSKKIETTNSGATITGLLGGASSVSATTVSGVTFNGMPYPPPFAYAQTTSDGTAEDGEQTVGIGADITSLVSNSNDLSWNDTGKYFNVSAAGTYEFTLKLITTVGGTTNITVKLKKNTDVKNTVISRIHSSIDPTETTVTAIFTAVSTDTISATTTDDNTDDITVNSGTTMMLKRLK